MILCSFPPSSLYLSLPLSLPFSFLPLFYLFLLPILHKNYNPEFSLVCVKKIFTWFGNPFGLGVSLPPKWKCNSVWAVLPTSHVLGIAGKQWEEIIVIFPPLFFCSGSFSSEAWPHVRTHKDTHTQIWPPRACDVFSGDAERNVCGELDKQGRGWRTPAE